MIGFFFNFLVFLLDFRIGGAKEIGDTAPPHLHPVDSGPCDSDDLVAASSTLSSELLTLLLLLLALDVDLDRNSQALDLRSELPVFDVVVPAEDGVDGRQDDDTEPEEAGDVITFLASERASYLTGIAVNLDGGASAVV